MLRDLPRIVSLLPSATETVCALGAGHALLGRSHECDFPDAVLRLPVLTRSRISNASSSAAIDAAVRGVAEDALSIYTVDEVRLAQLRPELILTQDLCHVCAVSLEDVRSAVAWLAQRDEVRVVSLHPRSLAGVLGDIEAVAVALGHAERGRAVRQALEASMEKIAARAGKARSRPRVASIEWLEPLMLGGTWMPELIALAGGEAVGVHAGELAPTLSSSELARLAPDVVLIKPCGFELERTLRERELIERAVLSALPPNARAYASDGNAFFNRPGPRLLESLEILAACVHPELFADFARKHAQVLLPFAVRGTR